MLTKSKETAPSHLNLYSGLEEAFDKCLIEQMTSKKTVEDLFKKNKWGKRDRKFFLDVFYNGIRWKSWIEYLMQDTLQKNSIRIFTEYLVYYSFQDLPLISYFKHFKPKENIKKPTLTEEISYPEWMVELAKKENSLHELQAMNLPAKFVIRANTIKISKEELQNKLQLESYKLSKTQLIDDAILFDTNPNLKQSIWYKEGYLEFQDFHSQQIAKLLKPKEKQLIVDACAGAGGKSLHLAALTKNKARIVALDTRKSALTELKKRKVRSGAYSIKTALNSPYTRQELNGRAHIVLVDAPCSGSGTIRRQPEIKWHLDEKKIKNYSIQQKKILSENSIMVKESGTLMYVTCSIFREENQEVVQWFLKNNPNFTLRLEKNLLPSKGFDGFYFAIMEKNIK